jgi:two-component system response regulator QseB
MTAVGSPAPTRIQAARLLLVEDDYELAGLLGRVLTDEGYAVTCAGDGHRGLHLALTSRFEVMIIDRGLPAVEGLDLIARLRSRGITTPILVLSARGTTEDRVDGLDAGAEDYLAKPFELTELLARIRALVRRHPDRAEHLPVPGGSLELAARTVRRTDGQWVELSEREASLLALLAARPGTVFSRSDLLDRIFDAAESETIVDTYVHYLRRKLGHGVVSTVRGLGYRLGGS